jgi:hypothetical protein
MRVLIDGVALRRAIYVLLGLLAVMSASVWSAPTVRAIPDLTAEEGGVVTPLSLDAFIDDPEYPDDALVWRIETSGDLLTAIVERTLYVSAPHTDWFGAEDLRLEVCNPDGECADCEVHVDVAAINDPPLLDLPSQIAVEKGDTFAPLLLRVYVTDIDDAVENLVWSAEGNNDLTISLQDGVLSVTPPDASWIGAEDITIRVLDSGGASAQGRVQFVVADENALSIRFIRNAGFQLLWNGHSVMIDAVYGGSAAVFPDIVTAEPPFQADLLLYTHSHADHFDPDIVVQYMHAQPETELVAPLDAVLRVLAIDPSLESRSTGVTLERNSSMTMVRAGIPLTLADFPHGGTPNVAYLIRLGEHAVFHSGDVLWSQVELRRLLILYGIQDADVTVALLVPVFFSSTQFREVMRDGIAARFYVPDHVKPGSFSYYIDLASREDDILILDEPLQTWVIPSQN